MTHPIADRATALKMTVRDGQLGRSFHQAEKSLADLARGLPETLSLTHADVSAYPPPSSAGRRYAQALESSVDPFSSYLGVDHVREVLAPRVSALLGIDDIEPQTELLIAAGTQNALFSIFSMLVEQGDTVLLADPEYMTIEKTVRYFGGRAVHLPARSTEAGPLEMSLDDIERGFAAGSRLLAFSNPCNPTGTVYGGPFLKALADLVLAHDAYVIVDELYSRLVYDVEFTSLASLPGMRDRCITTLGTSKTESMSGFRVGCMVGPAEIVSELSDIIEITSLRASSYAQYALLDWLGPDDDFVAERVATFKQLRALTVATLAPLPFLDLVTPDGTAYVFPRLAIADVDDFVVAETLVRDAGVLVNPGITFGPNGVGGFRLCFAQNQHELPGILQRVAGSLTALAHERG